MIVEAYDETQAKMKFYAKMPAGRILEIQTAK
jgi:hypothetical protein